MTTATMDRQRERIRPVEMTISASTGSIRMKGLPAREDGQPPYIRMLISEDRQKLLVQSAKKKMRYSVRMVTAEGDPDSYVIEKCGLFIDRLYRMMSWDFYLNYTLAGAPSELENARGLLFDLMETTALPYERPIPRSARQPVPREWAERMV